ncbi:MAG: hypothetical protein CL940_01380 [Deltaproteobacteria bacterium]|nr:hypothetical protein [Deltaproteobacteria bacterium]
MVGLDLVHLGIRRQGEIPGRVRRVRDVLALAIGERHEPSAHRHADQASSRGDERHVRRGLSALEGHRHAHGGRSADPLARPHQLGELGLTASLRRQGQLAPGAVLEDELQLGCTGGEANDSRALQGGLELVAVHGDRRDAVVRSHAEPEVCGPSGAQCAGELGAAAHGEALESKEDLRDVGCGALEGVGASVQAQLLAGLELHHLTIDAELGAGAVK